MADSKKSRVVLQFNEMDFRHRRALEILRKRPRSMSELVVNAILHYTSCPEAENEFGREWVAGIVKEVLAEMKAAGDLPVSSSTRASETHEANLAEEDLADLGGVMGMFRSQGGSHE